MIRVETVSLSMAASLRVRSIHATGPRTVRSGMAARRGNDLSSLGQQFLPPSKLLASLNCRGSWQRPAGCRRAGPIGAEQLLTLWRPKGLIGEITAANRPPKSVTVPSGHLLEEKNSWRVDPSAESIRSQNPTSEGVRFWAREALAGTWAGGIHVPVPASLRFTWHHQTWEPNDAIAGGNRSGDL
jgi:hypothetical protein